MKKRFILIILVLLIFLVFDNCYASSLPGWGYQRKHPSYAFVNDCGSNSCPTSLNANGENIGNSDFFYYQGNYTNMSANGNGIMWTYSVDNPIKSGIIYSLSTYICYQSNANLTLKGSYSDVSANNVFSKSHSTYNYYINYFSSLETQPFTSSSIFTKCGVVYQIIRPTIDSSFIGINISLASSQNNFTSALIGYDLEALGNANQLSSSDITNAIQSSGLATANDISSLNTSVSNLQTSINNNVNRAEANIVQNVTDGVATITDNLADESANIQANQDANTDREIESQKVCKYIDKANILLDNSALISQNGSSYSASGFGVTDYLSVRNSTIKITSISNPGTTSCFYDLNKNFISCFSNSQYSDSEVTIPQNAQYIRFTISKSANKPTADICTNGNQAMNDSINNVNDSLNNSDTSGANSDAGSFFSGFTTNNHGLTSIITKPLEFINGLSSSVCYDLSLPMPFINQNVTLPCMLPIYQQYFGSFLTLYQTITTGFIAYWVCVNIFRMVKGFKNPESDQVEVMDL